jgi:hypothetical protein
MSAGYGRGYYGTGQLAPQAPRRRGSGWIKLAVVVGVGAVVWVMWPRSPKPEHAPGSGDDEPKPPSPPLPPPEAPPQQLALVQHIHQHVPHDQLTIAQSRGYSSQKAYEDAVVASARQLQETGAKVALAPHLQHLSSRLEP